MNIYVELTKEFNREKLRTIICSGQAVVLHRLAVMSKDGDWIIRKDEESLHFILKVYADYGAKYRFGAPLDIRYSLAGKPLSQAHNMIIEQAKGVLPFGLKETKND